MRARRHALGTSLTEPIHPGRRPCPILVPHLTACRSANSRCTHANSYSEVHRRRCPITSVACVHTRRRVRDPLLAPSSLQGPTRNEVFVDTVWYAPLSSIRCGDLPIVRMHRTHFADSVRILLPNRQFARNRFRGLQRAIVGSLHRDPLACSLRPQRMGAVRRVGSDGAEARHGRA